MSQFGLSVKNTTSVDRQFGLSVKNTTEVDRQFGLSIKSSNNVYVSICDELGNPIIADLTISNGSDIDGLYTGSSGYSFTSSTFQSIDFSAQSVGFIQQAPVIENLFENGFTDIKIILLQTKVLFSCDTFPVNENGSRISKILEGGKIRVVYTGSSAFDPINYSFYLEAYIKGSAKTSVVQLNGVIVELTTNSVTVDFESAGGQNYCYIPNYSLRQC